ncbi:MAG TPA: PAS domain S-box protein, partial [Burkholderiales bacterium]|nr:PAS domain S-box protein [Burkholderiales bacterium]
MAPLRSRLSRIPLGRALIALGIVLVAINIASAIWDVRKAYERTERRAQRDFSNVSSLLAEQTASSLEAVDLILREAARKGSAADVVAGLPRLRAELAHVPQVAALLVLDADANVIARSEADAFDPARFTLFREAGAEGRYISDPYPDERGRWRLLISRQLGGPRSAAIAVAIELEGFDQRYATLDLGPGAFITLLSYDGAIIARAPDAQVRGRRYRTPGMADAVRGEGSWRGWSSSPIMNERVLLAASAVRGFPLYVMSGANERAVFAPWRDEAWLVFDRTLLTSAAMLGLLVLAAWGLARRERALGRSWKRYQAMIEHSADALILSRPTTGGILYASPAMERVLGFTLDDLRGRE